MKKSYIPDFRRETQELIKGNDIPASTIAKEFGVSTSTAYNWIAGKKSPTRRNFERLKKLAAGELGEPSREEPMLLEVIKILGRLELRMENIESHLGLEKKTKEHRT